MKLYNVCCPRQYKAKNGETKTHFWIVGTGFPLKERDGVSIKLYTRVLPSDELVLLVKEPREGAGAGDAEDPQADDDIPF